MYRWDDPALWIEVGDYLVLFLFIIFVFMLVNSRGHRYSFWTHCKFDLKIMGILMKETFCHPNRPAYLEVDRDQLTVRVVLPNNDQPE